MNKKEKEFILPSVKHFCYVLSINYCFAKVSLVENICNYATVYDAYHKLQGLVFAVNEFDMDVLLLCTSNEISINQKMIIGDIFKFNFNSNMLGKVISSTGKILLGDMSTNDIDIMNNSNYLDVFKDSPKICDRDNLSKSVLTGINVIDSCLPIGKGQRMLILGDRKVGKTSLCVSIIKNQSDYFNNICIYVFIAKKTRDIAQMFYDLKKSNIKNFIFISASASSSLAEQFLAPFIGCSIAEFFASKGKDVIITYDDLSKHARLYKEICIMSGAFPGRDAYPGDIFYLHAKLLERSVQIKDGGSITAIPIIETIEGEISEYIPTNLISITDGQIVLDKFLFNNDMRPAVNIQTSVSRVGAIVKNSFISAFTKLCKSDIVQSIELEKFYSFLDKNDIDDNNKNIIVKGRLWRAVFKQGYLECMPLMEQIVTFCLIYSDYFKNDFNIYNSEDYDFVNNKILTLVRNIINNAFIKELEQDILNNKISIKDFHKHLMNIACSTYGTIKEEKVF